jgi:hypothetical protein
VDNRNEPVGHGETDRWAMVPVAILGVPLTRAELRTFIALSGHANADREADVGQRRLAEEVEEDDVRDRRIAKGKAVDRRSVRRALVALEGYGLAERISNGRGRPDTWRVAPFEVGASGRAHSRGESGRIPSPKWAHLSAPETQEQTNRGRRSTLAGRRLQTSNCRRPCRRGSTVTPGRTRSRWPDDSRVDHGPDPIARGRAGRKV